jgi:monoamine oxidase
VSGLLSGLEIDIRLNNIVSEIDYSGLQGVTVKMADGSEITSDFAISTIPLGVL